MAAVGTKTEPGRYSNLLPGFEEVTLIERLAELDVWHSSDGVHWQELPGALWRPRHAASVFVYDDALWMVAENNMQKDVWKLVRQSK